MLFLLEVNNMVDIEMLRIEKLIEEREAYENAFFSMEYKDEEFKFRISQFEELYQDYLVEPIDYEYDLMESFEDYFEKLRDEKLIKERIAYEIEYFKNIDYNIIEIDVESINEPYDEPDYDIEPDFEMYYEEDFDPRPLWEPTFRKPHRCCWDSDYMPNDDFNDDAYCYYYPDGTLSGIYPL